MKITELEITMSSKHLNQINEILKSSETESSFKSLKSMGLPQSMRVSFSYSDTYSPLCHSWYYSFINFTEDEYQTYELMDLYEKLTNKTVSEDEFGAKNKRWERLGSLVTWASRRRSEPLASMSLWAAEGTSAEPLPKIGGAGCGTEPAPLPS